MELPGRGFPWGGRRTVLKFGWMIPIQNMTFVLPIGLTGYVFQLLFPKFIMMKKWRISD